MTISDFAAADRLAPQYLDQYPALVAGKNTPGSNPLANSVPVVSLNCSRAHVCQLNGLTITSATQSMGCPGCAHPPAVRVFSGEVVGLTVQTSQKLGANDCVDEENVPVGQWASRSWGGWTLVGKASASESTSKVPSALTAQGSTPSHAVLAGVSGEPHARLAVETSGETFYGNGTGEFHTGVRQHIAGKALWDPPAIGPGDRATTTLALPGAQPGDIVSAAHAALGQHFEVSIAARVTAPGEVTVALHNSGEVVDLEKGIVRAAIVQYV